VWKQQMADDLLCGGADRQQGATMHAA